MAQILPIGGGPLDDPKQIIATIKKLLAEEDIKLRDVAKFTGYSASSISSLLNDNYGADPTNLLEALVRFYKNWIATDATVQISTVKRMALIMDLAWSQKEIGRIVGRFGSGKTRAAQYYAAKNPEFARYLSLTSTETPNSFLNRIAEALNIGTLSGSLNDKLFAIIRGLQRESKLLIIDEADELKARTLAVLRDIHGGSGAGRCGIVLLATSKIKALMKDPALGYLESRVRIKFELDVNKLTFDEVRKIVDLWPHRLSKDDLAQAWEWSKKRHALRSLDALMSRAYNFMQYEKGKFITDDNLAAAYELLVD